MKKILLSLVLLSSSFAFGASFSASGSRASSPSDDEYLVNMIMNERRGAFITKLFNDEKSVTGLSTDLLVITIGCKRIKGQSYDSPLVEDWLEKNTSKKILSIDFDPGNDFLSSARGCNPIPSEKNNEVLHLDLRLSIDTVESGKDVNTSHLYILWQKFNEPAVIIQNFACPNHAKVQKTMDSFLSSVRENNPDTPRVRAIGYCQHCSSSQVLVLLEEQVDEEGFIITPSVEDLRARKKG